MQSEDMIATGRNVLVREYGRGITVELCTLFGIIEPFPNHFHDYYVIGMVAGGKRRLTVCGDEYVLGQGDLVMFNARDPHACEAADGSVLDYRCFNIPTESMDVILADFGRTFDHDKAPLFPRSVVSDPGLFSLAGACHRAGTDPDGAVEEVEAFFFFIERLLAFCTVDQSGEGPADQPSKERTRAVDAVCAFLDGHYAERVGLDEMAEVAGMSRYALLRAFVREKGITPYRYLTTLRIIEARRMLAAGVDPAATAATLGFSDQAHFGRVFKEITGVTPGAYRVSCAEGSRLGNAWI